MFVFHAMDSETARAFRAGAPDAYGIPPERTVSDGVGNPCRHCLDEVPAGRVMLILAWRPFESVQPYAETGPVFLCGHECERYPRTDALPPIFDPAQTLLMRGYDRDERIVYGTGAWIRVKDLGARVGALFARPEIAHVDLRSAANNCFQFRVRRARPAPMRTLSWSAFPPAGLLP